VQEHIKALAKNQSRKMIYGIVTQPDNDGKTHSLTDEGDLLEVKCFYKDYTASIAPMPQQCGKCEREIFYFFAGQDKSGRIDSATQGQRVYNLSIVF
jgi:hypothetical protein